MQLRLAVALALIAPGVAAASLTGRVEGIDGAPAARARVSVVAIAGAWEPRPGETLPGAVLGSAVAGEDGSFAIEADAIPAGLHALRVEAEGRLPVLMGGTRVAFGAPALPQDLRLVLTSAVTLEGLVLDASGARVAGADVRIAARSPLHASTSRATTDDEGRFRVAGLPGLTGAEIRAMAGEPARRGWVLDALPLSGAFRTVVEVEQVTEDEEPVGDGPVASPRIVRGIVSSRAPDGT